MHLFIPGSSKERISRGKHEFLNKQNIGIRINRFSIVLFDVMLAATFGRKLWDEDIFIYSKTFLTGALKISMQN